MLKAILKSSFMMLVSDNLKCSRYSDLYCADVSLCLPNFLPNFALHCRGSFLDQRNALKVCSLTSHAVSVEQQHFHLLRG